MSIDLPDLTSQVELDHERLNELKGYIFELVDEDVDHKTFLRWKVETLFRLRDFHNQLTKHFDLEEIGGFYADLLRLSPEASNRVQLLKQEHVEILRGLGRIISELKSAEAAASADHELMRRDLHLILRRLKSHEGLESELLYSAHHQVYGAGD